MAYHGVSVGDGGILIEGMILGSLNEIQMIRSMKLLDSILLVVILSAIGCSNRSTDEEEFRDGTMLRAGNLIVARVEDTILIEDPDSGMSVYYDGRMGKFSQHIPETSGQHITFRIGEVRGFESVVIYGVSEGRIQVKSSE